MFIYAKLVNIHVAEVGITGPKWREIKTAVITVIRINLNIYILYIYRERANAEEEEGSKCLFCKRM
jgi:PP-loop superfamily ATP-utilizing enzyme